MVWAHLHLAVNHLPVVLLPVALVMLVLAVRRESAELTKAGLGVVITAAIIAGGVYFTGEPAEEAIQRLRAVSPVSIEVHEKAAFLAVIVTGFAGLLARGTLLACRRRSRLIGWMMPATVVVAIVGAGLMARTANLGGQISHPEIRGPAARASVVVAVPAN